MGNNDGKMFIIDPGNDGGKKTMDVRTTVVPIMLLSCIMNLDDNRLHSVGIWS